MDEHVFDDWTRSWGVAQSRRRALLTLGGGGLAALLGHLDLRQAAACRKAKKRCQRDGQCCSGRCRKGRCKGNAQPPADACLGKQAGDDCGGGCSCLPKVSGSLACGDARGGACVEDVDCLDALGPGAICFVNKNGDGQCAAVCPIPVR